MSRSDLRFFIRYSKILPKNKPHELKEFFPEGIWNNKSNVQKRTLGRKFKRYVRMGMIDVISRYEVHSNKHTYYYITE